MQASDSKLMFQVNGAFLYAYCSGTGQHQQLVALFLAAGEKRNLPFSVFSVPRFSSSLTILAFATFIANAYSSIHRPDLKKCGKSASPEAQQW